MGGPQLVFFIVLIVGAVQIVKIIYGAPKKSDHRAIHSLNDRLKALEKRIENIETIATSKEFELKREFEKIVH